MVNLGISTAITAGYWKMDTPDYMHWLLDASSFALFWSTFIYMSYVRAIGSYHKRWVKPKDGGFKKQDTNQLSDAFEQTESVHLQVKDWLLVHFERVHEVS